MNKIILAVEDERGVLESYKEIFRGKHKVIAVTSAEEALDLLKKEEVDLVIMDIRLPGMDGVKALKKIKEIDGTIEVIMVTAVQTIKTAIESMKLGAYDYITKPIEIDEFTAVVNRALQKREMSKELYYLKSELKPVKFENIIGESLAIKRIYEFINEMSRSDSTVLITGESGTGKELIARAIHYKGSRKEKPFVAVDCASIPENLLESELFGYEKGAFTDAKSQKPGKFEMANGGTLFLDEIGNMPKDMQSKLLRVIESRDVQRLGSIRNIKIDVRIISATNIDLKKAVEEGEFRQDLYYRLNVIPINIPPLRERDGDVELLFKHYLNIFNSKFNKNIQTVAKDAMEALINYDWPGNVRELRNVVERVVALSRGNIILSKMLPMDIFFKNESIPKPSGKIPLRPARHKFEKQFISDVMEKCNWNQSRAARILNIHRNTLILKMRSLGLKSSYRMRHVPEVKP